LKQRCPVCLSLLRFITSAPLYPVSTYYIIRMSFASITLFTRLIGHSIFISFSDRLTFIRLNNPVSVLAHFPSIFWWKVSVILLSSPCPRNLLSKNITSVIIIYINILVMEFTPSTSYFGSLFLNIPKWWPCKRLQRQQFRSSQWSRKLISSQILQNVEHFNTILVTNINTKSGAAHILISLCFNCYVPKWSVERAHEHLYVHIIHFLFQGFFVSSTMNTILVYIYILTWSSRIFIMWDLVQNNLYV
jgi:hypothetical protein